jgi:peptidoglycan/xylan/chitin deacetylase (PgdA/CDA1 family)
MTDMKIPGSKAARKFSRWLQARVRGGALILGYHRVTKAVQDGYEVSVACAHFEEQMDALSRSAHVMSLSTLVGKLKEGPLPSRSVAVTFDDGYADNLYLAKPILEKYQVSATVFVCTGYWGRQFWWDELETLIMFSTSDPGALCLDNGNEQAIWKLPVEISGAKDFQDAAIRKKLRHELYHFLLAMDVDEQNRAMDDIRNWAGVAAAGTSVSARSLDRAELIKLADGGQIEIGAHTRTHPLLPRLSHAQQRDEILSSRQDLEELLGKPVPGFAYPNGRATKDTKRILENANFEYACVSQEDIVRPGSDLLALPRFWQKDVDGEKFLRHLNGWL